MTTPLAGSPNEPESTIILQGAAAPTGLYHGVPAAYDPATHSLSTAKPSGNSAFYKVKSDSSVAATGISVNTTNVTVKLQ